MNEIRLNTEVEQKIAEARFGVPKLLKTAFISLVGILLFISLIVIISFVKIQVDNYNFFSQYDRPDVEPLSSYIMRGILQGFLFSIYIYIVVILFVVIYFLIKSKINKCKCVITNKMIKGVNAGILGTKYYSYRLDQIENVEIQTSLGIKSLALQFSQGQMNSNVVTRYGTGQKGISGTNVFLITNVINEKELYKKLTELLLKVKNDKDVAVDIAIKKIETEEKKTEAFYKIAEGLTDKKQNVNESNDYISQLERLYKLKEQGIITEEEFNEKKAKLL